MVVMKEGVELDRLDLFGSCFVSGSSRCQAGWFLVAIDVRV